MTRGLRWAAGCALALLAVLIFLHLGADLPHYSPWRDDAARFTDEGWYASGAIRKTLLGHWLEPGDFNPVITIPAWSVLLAFVFHFTGVSLIAARACAVVCTFVSVAALYDLLRKTLPKYAGAGSFLLASSPILFFFSRAALLEPPLVCCLLLTTCAALRVQRVLSASAVLTGVLFTLAMLVKSSALFVAPALMYLIWARAVKSSASEKGVSRLEMWRTARLLLLPVGTATILYFAYWFAVIRPHESDFQVLLRQNPPVLRLHSIEKVVRLVYRTVYWVDWVLVPFAAAGALLMWRNLSRRPLFGFAVLWYAGYALFMVLHYDAGPRYFAVLTVPVVVLVLLTLDELPQVRPEWTRPADVLVLAAVLWNLATIARLMLRVDYSFESACQQIAGVINADHTRLPLVLGHGAMESTLVTRIPALDDLGTQTVTEKLVRQHPGWVVTYSDAVGIVGIPIDEAHDTAVLVGDYPVFDLPDRSRLLLYRIGRK